MSGKIFQSIIIQMKDATMRTIAVIDADGTAVASTDLSLIGSGTEKSGLPPPGYNDSDVWVHNGRTYKTLGKGDTGGYAVFAEGEDDTAKTICRMAAIALGEAGAHHENKQDKLSFVKTIISDNILPADLFARAGSLNFSMDVVRGVTVIHFTDPPDTSMIKIIREVFPDEENDYIFKMNNNDIVIVKEIPLYADTEYLTGLAGTVHEEINTKTGCSPVIGIGTPSQHLHDIAQSYKQAQIAIDISKVFGFTEPIVSYENLGIGRLIYQLPVTLCEIFLSEVFKTNPIETLDEETLTTIREFFGNSLNVSETARKLYIHRNTLVYRLDKIKKITGLDLREFDQAIVFKVALLVNKYLMSQKPRQ